MTAKPETHHRPVLAAQYRLQFEPAQDAWVLLYPEGMVKLNKSAAEILRRCDGSASVDEVISGLERDYAPMQLRDDVCLFLEDAHGRGWIV
jgi:pyrroloquinoline quinone biosynthesis protein D